MLPLTASFCFSWDRCLSQYKFLSPLAPSTFFPISSYDWLPLRILPVFHFTLGLPFQHLLSCFFILIFFFLEENLFLQLGYICFWHVKLKNNSYTFKPNQVLNDWPYQMAHSRNLICSQLLYCPFIIHLFNKVLVWKGRGQDHWHTVWISAHPLPSLHWESWVTWGPSKQVRAPGCGAKRALK